MQITYNFYISDLVSRSCFRVTRNLNLPAFRRNMLYSSSLVVQAVRSPGIYVTACHPGRFLKLGYDRFFSTLPFINRFV